MHRDPETGQFVNDTGHSAEYRDLEQLHVHSRYNVDAADLPGAFPIQETDLHAVDFSDILDREERADLIMLQVHALQATVTGTSSAESALRASWELGLGNGDAMILDEDKESESATGSSGVIDRNLWQSDSPDVLFFADWVAEGGFADSGNSIGAGPDAPVITEDFNFAKEIAACPELDDRDEITESFFLADQGSANIDDSLIHLQASYSLVFSVRDRVC